MRKFDYEMSTKLMNTKFHVKNATRYILNTKYYTNRTEYTIHTYRIYEWMNDKIRISKKHEEDV